MSLKYMGVPDRCQHGEYEDKCPYCQIEAISRHCKEMRARCEALIDIYKRLQLSQGKVELKISYFKESGKYYLAHYGLLLNKYDFPGCIYPGDYVKKLKERKQLPGLNSGEWDGPILAEIDYPELVLPEVSENTKG